MEKHRILDAVQMIVKNVKPSQEPNSDSQSELLEFVKTDGMEHDLAQDRQLDCALSNLTQISESGPDFVASVMARVSRTADTRAFVAIPERLDRRPDGHSQETADLVDVDQKLDGIPKVDPIPKVAPIPKATPTTSRPNIPKVTPVPEVVHASKVQPKPRSTAAESPKTKDENQVIPIARSTSAKERRAPRFKGAPELASKPRPSEQKPQSSPVSIKSKRQYDRMNSRGLHWSLFASLAFATILTSVIAFFALRDSKEDSAGAHVASKKIAPSDRHQTAPHQLEQKHQATKRGEQSSGEKSSSAAQSVASDSSQSNNKENLVDNVQPNEQQAQPLRFAQILESQDAIWNKTPSSDTDAGYLFLSSGRVKMQMNNGAEVEIVGPASFQLKSADLLMLNSGKLAAYVPPKAVGFTVETPASRVVDLGTEFDVSVDEIGATGVRVRTGEVEVEPMAQDSGGRQKWSLREGDFKWIDRDGRSHDWNLTLKLDESGLGAVDINGRTFELTDKVAFDAAKKQIQMEFQRFEKEFLSRNPSAEKPFSGVINLAGSKMDFDSAKGFEYAKTNASEKLNGIESIMDDYSAAEIIDRIRSSAKKMGLGKGGAARGIGSVVEGIQSAAERSGRAFRGGNIFPGLKASKDGISLPGMSVGKEGISLPGLNASKDGIEISPGKLPGTNKGSQPNSSADPILTYGKDGFTTPGMIRRRKKEAEKPGKPGPNELILNVTGAGGEFRLRTTDGEPVSDSRVLKGAGPETEINVSKAQKITLKIDGAGNKVYVPTSIRKNVRTVISGAGNEVEYFVERTRFREKLRKEREKTGDRGTSGASGTSRDSQNKPPRYADREYSDSRINKRESKKSKLSSAVDDAMQLSSEKSQPSIPKSDRVGTQLIVVSGINNTVNLEVTSEEVESGIRVVHGIKENSTITVGAKQTVVIYLDGIRNEAIVPVEFKANVVGRLEGIENRIVYRSKSGSVVGGYELQSRDQQRQYSKTKKVSQGFLVGTPKYDKSVLLILIEGEKQDVILRKAKRRADYGVKFAQGRSNEVTYNVLPEQQVYVLNKARQSIVFVAEDIRESVSIENKGSKNEVDYFE